MDEKPEEVSASYEDKAYTTYLLNGFKIKTGDDALENFKDKLAGKTDTETKMMAWVQGKMRLANPKKPAKEGTFDKASKRFLDHIFKEELKDARKQTKLTDKPDLPERLATAVEAGAIIGKSMVRENEKKQNLESAMHKAIEEGRNHPDPPLKMKRGRPKKGK